MTGIREIEILDLKDRKNITRSAIETYKYLKSNSLDGIITINDSDLKKASLIVKCSPSTVNSSLYKLKDIGAIKIIRKKISRKRTIHEELSPDDKGYNYFTVVKSKYGLGKQEIEKLWEKQGKKCPICGKSEENSGRRFHIDHCHVTGKIRGLLCSKCNMGIGIFDESIIRMQVAIVYLLQHSI